MGMPNQLLPSNRRPSSGFPSAFMPASDFDRVSSSATYKVDGDAKYETSADTWTSDPELITITDELRGRVRFALASGTAPPAGSKITSVTLRFVGGSESAATLHLNANQFNTAGDLATFNDEMIEHVLAAAAFIDNGTEQSVALNANNFTPASFTNFCLELLLTEAASLGIPTDGDVTAEMYLDVTWTA